MGWWGQSQQGRGPGVCQGQGKPCVLVFDAHPESWASLGEGNKASLGGDLYPKLSSVDGCPEQQFSTLGF